MFLNSNAFLHNVLNNIVCFFFNNICYAFIVWSGVKLINLKEGVSVASIAKVVEDKTLMPPDEAKAETDESENSDEDSAENNNSHAEAIENNTEA